MNIEEAPKTDTGAKVIQNKLYGRRISKYKLHKDGIPIIIHNLVTKIYSNQNFL